MKPFYLTTTLPYVNADPHIGFALELVQADTTARSRRLLGEEVIFNTGTDEHGQKIFEAAQKAGQDPQQYVDHYAGQFEKLKSALNLSYDHFIRTTSAEHVRAAEEMWRRCHGAGDIYKKEFEGLYCVGCEKYLTERDMKDGVCLIHGKPPELIKEENYFFRFSKYQDLLLEYLNRPGSIVPEWRREEARAFVASGLEDFSISREKAKSSWGVPVPGDETQVMYVWFDALTSYISTLGWPLDDGGMFEKFWSNGEILQVAGKDQVRFQSLMWQAMLFSAGIKNTDQVFYHGFITSGGQKMSKSLGNVISPYELVEKYGTEATRYLLLRHVHPFEDSDVTWELMDEWYNGGLANGLGNLTSRLLKMSEQYIPGAPEIFVDTIPTDFSEFLEKYEFNKAMDFVWAEIQSVDQKIQETEPFRLAKTDLPAAQKILSELLVRLSVIARMLTPLLPETSRIIQESIKANKKPDNLFARKN